MPSKVWNEITYPFPNFHGCTVEVWECLSNFITYPTLYNGCNYLSILRLKLFRVSRMRPTSFGNLSYKTVTPTSTEPEWHAWLIQPVHRERQAVWYISILAGSCEIHVCIYGGQEQYHFQYKDTGGRLNKKDGLTRYGDSHVKDKTS